MRGRRRGRTPSPTFTAALSVVLAVLAGAVLSAAPCFYRSVSVEGADGVVRGRVECSSLVAAEGLWVVALFVIPVGLATLGLAAVRRRSRRTVWAATALLLVFCLASVASFGLFFLPAAIALLLSALAMGSQEPAPA
jgi:hypothetical protein